MRSIHENSPCCREIVYRFGGRRRQCSRCKRTWRAWKRKRGPERQRRNVKGLVARLIDKRPVRVGIRTLSRSGAYKRFHETLKWFVRKKRMLRLGGGPYILIGDGLWFRFDGEVWVLYLIAVRPLKSRMATFLDPVLLRGREYASTWKQALEHIPTNVKRDTVAFVSDAFKGSRILAEERGWCFQSCQFHCVARFHVYRGRNKLLRGAKVRTEIWETMRAALASRGDVHAFTKRLAALAEDPECHHMLRRRTRGFVRDIDTYRTYAQYPDLHLPSTTATVETMNSLLRSVLRGLCTPRSVLLWATAFIRLRPQIVCNGK